jgi:hypothetical protein
MNLNAHQKRLLEMYPPPRLFAVISWGCAGTSWLTHALNSHRDIYCVHADNVLWKALGGAPYVDGVDYLRIIGAQGYSHALAGEIHGTGRDKIPELVATFGDRFRAAVVIREPVPRLMSQLALMNFYRDYQKLDIDYVAAYSDLLGADVAAFSYDRKLRLHAINMLNAVVDEVKVGPVFRIEDLGRSAAIFTEFLAGVSAGTVLPYPGWLDGVFALPRSNSHVRRQPITLTDDDRHALRRLVREESWALYEKFGYTRPTF